MSFWFELFHVPIITLWICIFTVHLEASLRIIGVTTLFSFARV